MVKYFLSILFCSLLMMLINASQDSMTVNPSNESVGSYKIEGKIIVPPGDNALENTRILIDEGLYVGIPQVDGTFVICGIFFLFIFHNQIKYFHYLRCSKWFIYRFGYFSSSCIRTRSC